MSDAPIQGHSFTIHQLFSGDRTFGLDAYQREFSWERKDVQTLVRDLYRSFDKSWKPSDGRKETAHYAPYFLGPYVYFRGENTTYLVDGQQRLTTLHLLLIHLYRLLLERDEGREAEKIASLISTSKHGEELFTVFVPERIPLMTALFKGKRYHLPNNATPSVRALYARARDLEEDFPEELRGEALLHFVDWLLDRVCLIGIEALDRDHGWEIFVTMNDRGARLAPIDLLKGHLLERAQLDGTDLNVIWRDMLTRLSAVDPHAPGQFLNTLLLSHYADILDPLERDEIERAAHEWVRTRAGVIGLSTAQGYREFIRKTVDVLSHRYQTLLAASSRFDESYRAVYYNAVNGIDDQFLLILAAVEADDSDELFREKSALVSSFIDLVFVRKAVNGTINKPENLTAFIYDLIPDVRENRDIDKLRALLSGRIAQLSDEFTGMGTFGLRPGSSRTVRYLLARITAHVEVECGKEDQFDVYVDRETPHEIEHIWADKFERYQADVKDVQTFHAIRNRLGALILLPKLDNASFGAKTYQEKLPYYFRQNILAASLHKNSYQHHVGYRKFREHAGLVRVFTHYDEFTKTSIIERQKLYERLCELIWDPSRLGFAVPKSLPPERRVARRTRARYDVTIAELIDVGSLKANEKISGSHRGVTYDAEIRNDGRIQIPSGEVFDAPSRAAMFLIDRQSCNGWVFWRVRRGTLAVSLKDLRDEALRAGLTEILPGSEETQARLI